MVVKPTGITKLDLEMKDTWDMCILLEGTLGMLHFSKINQQLQPLKVSASGSISFLGTELQKDSFPNRCHLFPQSSCC